MSNSSNPKSFMVTGATGYQGGSLTRQLISRGHVVNALVRNTDSEKAQAIAKLGVKVFKGTFIDKDAVEQAMKGVSGVFFNPFPTPGDFDSQYKQADTIIEAAVKEGCPLVLSTCVYTSQPDKWENYEKDTFLYLFFSRKFEVEARVRKAPLKSYSIIRPPYLFHNYLLPFSNFHYPELSEKGIVKDMYHNGRRFSHGDSADVGKIVAVIFEDPQKYNRLEMDFAQTSMNVDDAVAVINKVSGRKDIKTHKVPDEGFDQVKKTGLTWHFFSNTQDVAATNPEEIEQMFGVRLTTFEEYLQREQALLTKTLPELPN